MKIKGSYPQKSREVNLGDIERITLAEKDLGITVEEKVTFAIQSLFQEMFVGISRRLRPGFAKTENGYAVFSFDDGNCEDKELFTLKVSYTKNKWDFYFTLTPEGIESVETD